MTRAVDDAPLATPAAMLLGLEALAEHWDPILAQAMREEGHGCGDDRSVEPGAPSDHGLIAILLGWISLRRTVTAQIARLPDASPPAAALARSGWLR